MSSSAIELLPPFANAGTPIIWIDDHLKRRLHEALGHFSRLVPITSCRTCNNASFRQDRYPGGVSQHYLDGDYLSRLSRGIVMDNLIWDHDSHPAAPGPYTNFVKKHAQL